MYIRNQTCGEIKPVYSSSFRKTTPKVSGNNVVFVDERYGYEAIVLINLSSGEEEIICHVPEIHWQPDIDKDWIVWEDWRNGAHSRGDIYAYHIPTKAEVQVTNTPWGDWFPSVSSGWVVWQSQKYGNH
ncbi:MAG TPA: hypothetical protein PLY78_09280 [Methanospirillum sp.]|nr:hypothetical protein [Methanospirillum sp.]